MTKQPHNGWTNYETWNVKLWMDNDDGSHRYWTERAEEALKRDEPDEATEKLANWLENEHQERLNDLLEGNSKTGNMSASWIADILGAAFQEVNWQEIAESLIGDAKEALEQ